MKCPCHMPFLDTGSEKRPRHPRLGPATLSPLRSEARCASVTTHLKRLSQRPRVILARNILALLMLMPPGLALAQTPLPIPSPSGSPVHFFRELLSMSEAERTQALADKPETKRRVLLAKIREYNALPDAEREHRLQRLELPAYLLPLMNASPEFRAHRLPAIPEPYRNVVEARLQQWDRLPETQKKEVMTNQVVLQYFFRPAVLEMPVLQNTNRLSIMPPPLRAKLESGLKRWLVLSDAERQALTTQFKEFISRETSDREKILQSFPQPRQSELKGALQALATLPPDQLDECLAGFHKLAQLNPNHRLQFILNLQRWQTMTAQERNAWRRMVSRVNQPPRPPEKQRPPMPRG